MNATVFTDEVKIALRISTANTAFDSEIEMLIASACKDLILAGVLPSKFPENIDTLEDPLLKRAIVTYCKANFGYDNPEAERFQKAYDSLKLHLLLSSEYGGASDEA